MTTPSDNTGKPDNYFEWNVTPPKKGAAAIDFYDALRLILKPYVPVEQEEDSDLQYTTNELIQAVETHYAIPQGDPGLLGIDGEKLVEYMITLGFHCANTGGLQLQWLLKKR
jgi:hypothetical protein